MSSSYSFLKKNQKLVLYITKPNYIESFLRISPLSVLENDLTPLLKVLTHSFYQRYNQLSLLHSDVNYQSSKRNNCTYPFITPLKTPLFFFYFIKRFIISQGSHFDEQCYHYDVFLPSRTYLESSSRSFFLNCEDRPLLTNKVLDIVYRVPSSDKVLYTLFNYLMSKNTLFCDWFSLTYLQNLYMGNI